MTEEKSQMDTDRRRVPRRKEPTLVRFEGDNFSIYSRALDVSDRGAFLATHYLLDPGTAIQLHFLETPGGEVTTSARVVRTTTRTTERGEISIGLGVEFVDEDSTAV